MDTFDLRMKVGNSAAVKVCPKGCQAIVEPSYSMIWGPSAEINAMAKAYGWKTAGGIFYNVIDSFKTFISLENS